MYFAAVTLAHIIQGDPGNRVLAGFSLAFVPFNVFFCQLAKNAVLIKGFAFQYIIFRTIRIVCSTDSEPYKTT